MHCALDCLDQASIPDYFVSGYISRVVFDHSKCSYRPHRVNSEILEYILTEINTLGRLFFFDFGGTFANAVAKII